MCGRFAIHLLDLDVLREPLGLRAVHVEGWQPRYNVAPTQEAPVVVLRPERSLELLRWGLPARRGGDHGERLLINARIETVAEKPSFRASMASRRCVVPVTGFYEWKPLPGRRRKQPMWIHPREGLVLPLAGLWSPPAPGEAGPGTFAIVTRDAAGPLREIHDRMPLELRGPALDAWLDPKTRPGDLVDELSALEPDVSHLEATPVGSGVNTPAHDAPDCIAPVAEGEQDDEPQLDLFGR